MNMTSGLHTEARANAVGGGVLRSSFFPPTAKMEGKERGTIACEKGISFLSLLLLLSLFTVVGALDVAAQGSVRVQLFRPPPNQLKVADLWRVRLTNSSTTAIRVTLFGTVTELSDGLLVDARTTVLTLEPGTHLVVGGELEPIDANYYDDRYKDAFLRTGSVPDGTYRVCVSVRDAETDAELGTDCYDQPILNTRPPILVLPEDEAAVGDAAVAFTWLPPAPVNPGDRVTYRLKIVEILGRQTPYDAMQSNPAWHERDRITNPFYLWPLGARQFRPDREYAWMVTAERGGFPMGESEIWSFRWEKPETEEITIADRRGFADSLAVTRERIVLVNRGRIEPFVIERRGSAVSVGVVGAGVVLDPSKRAEVSDKFIPASVLEELLRSCSE